MNERDRRQKSIELQEKLNPNDYFNNVVSNPAFPEALNQVYATSTTEEEREAGRRLAFAYTAESIAKTHETQGGYKSFEGHIYTIISKLPSYLDSKLSLDRLSAQGATRRERLPYLEQVSKFNHVTKELIDNNTALTYSQLLLFMRQMNGKMGNGDKDEYFKQEMKQTLNGMRHELGFEQILGSIPNVVYDETTVEQDLKGEDYRISINNSPFMPIDLKSNPNRAHAAQEKAIRDGRNPHLIIWTGIDNQDFGNGFRLPYEAIPRYTQYVTEQLLAAQASLDKFAA